MTKTDDALITVQDKSPMHEYLAALDIGSNSFHFVLTRKNGEQLQTLHSEKYRVKLAQGLNHEGILDDEAITRGVAVLKNLASTTKELTRDNFRAVATYTLRQAKNAQMFLQAAEEVFPFDIEIISGHEEARLIYQGVANHSGHIDNQLVLDIGGGSTECIIGKEKKIKCLESLNIGCVSFSQRYFNEENITNKSFKKAIKAAKHEIDSIVKRFKKSTWTTTIGTSGTFKAIARIVNYEKEIPQPITLCAVRKLQDDILQFSTIDEVTIKGLKENRRGVICAGVAITRALMESLDIDAIEFGQYALREGVLYEQLENESYHKNNTANIKQRTVTNLVERFNIDQQQVDTISELLKNWHQALANKWQINADVYAELLLFAAQLHELGVDINPSGYHKHGHYILSQTDLPGFNQEQQQALAWLVGSQRKKILSLSEYKWHLLKPKQLMKMCVLLRLAIVFTQQRQSDNTYPINFDFRDKVLNVTIEKKWLIERPIVDTELFYEQILLEENDISLKIKTQ